MIELVSFSASRRYPDWIKVASTFILKRLGEWFCHGLIHRSKLLGNIVIVERAHAEFTSSVVWGNFRLGISKAICSMHQEILVDMRSFDWHFSLLHQLLE